MHTYVRKTNRLVIAFQKNSLNLSVEDNIMYYGLLSILDEVIFPAMSFLSGNCCVSEELWVLVKQLPYELR